MLEVEPEADALGDPVPLVLVLEHALAAAGVELGEAERLDLVLALDAEFLLHLDLDREPVRVPAPLAADLVPLHGPEAADQVLHRARENVVHAGAAVGGGRPLVEDEVALLGALVHRALEDVFRPPELEDALLGGGLANPGVEHGKRGKVAGAGAALHGATAAPGSGSRVS